MNGEHIKVHRAQHIQPWGLYKSIHRFRHHPPIALYFKPICRLLCTYHPSRSIAKYPMDLYEADGFLWRWGRLSVPTNHQVRGFHLDRSKILRKKFLPKISLSIYKRRKTHFRPYIFTRFPLWSLSFFFYRFQSLFRKTPSVLVLSVSAVRAKSQVADGKPYQLTWRRCGVDVAIKWHFYMPHQHFKIK